MEGFLRHLFLFLIVALAGVLHISVFKYGHSVLALLLFFVFFLSRHTAFIYACIAGILEDSITGPFGFHSIVYPFIIILGSVLCNTFITNKSFFAFFLLNIAGFLTYHIIGATFLFFQMIIQRQFILETVFSLEYLKEIGLGLGMQAIFLSALYGLRYRRMKFSRAYVYG
jgi:hypothetical protein